MTTKSQELNVKDMIEKVRAAEKAKKILLEGLKYHEHDGHDMPKRVARDALKALGVDEEDQP